MSANAAEAIKGSGPPPPVPKRITNAQTVCNERNEKNKLCNGHLKQLKTAGESAEVQLRGDDVLFKCHAGGTLYMGRRMRHGAAQTTHKRCDDAELPRTWQP